MANVERALRFIPAQTEHVAAMVRNETRSYAFPWTEGVFRDCIAGPQVCWVAVDDRDTVIGHAVFSVAVSEAHLLNICITRDQQGYGYGRAFLNFVLRELKRAGAEVLFLEVRPSNRVAAALYQSFGFREIGRRKDYYPAPLGREDATVLALQFEATDPQAPDTLEPESARALGIVARQNRDPNEHPEQTPESDQTKRDHLGTL